MVEIDMAKKHVVTKANGYETERKGLQETKSNQNEKHNGNNN